MMSWPFILVTDYPKAGFWARREYMFAFWVEAGDSFKR